jgi:hypothetical protein
MAIAIFRFMAHLLGEGCLLATAFTPISESRRKIVPNFFKNL